MEAGCADPRWTLADTRAMGGPVPVATAGLVQAMAWVLCVGLCLAQTQNEEVTRSPWRGPKPLTGEVRHATGLSDNDLWPAET